MDVYKASMLYTMLSFFIVASWIYASAVAKSSKGPIITNVKQIKSDNTLLLIELCVPNHESRVLKNLNALVEMRLLVYSSTVSTKLARPCFRLKTV